MKRAALALSALALLLALEVGAQEERPTSPAAGLAFLAGDWESRSEGESFRAHYSDPEGGMVVGVSKSVAKGEAVFFELEVFRIAEGALVLQPYPGGKAAASFRATKVAKDSITFANPENEFPKTITYARPAPERLEITLRGGGRERRFALKRLSR